MTTTFRWIAFLFLLSLSPSLWVIEMQWFYCSDDEHKYEISRQNEKKTHKRCDETSIVSLFSRNSFCALATDTVWIWFYCNHSTDHSYCCMCYYCAACGHGGQNLFFFKVLLSVRIYEPGSVFVMATGVFSASISTPKCVEKKLPAFLLISNTNIFIRNQIKNKWWSINPLAYNVNTLYLFLPLYQSFFSISPISFSSAAKWN